MTSTQTKTKLYPPPPGGYWRVLSILAAVPVAAVATTVFGPFGSWNWLAAIGVYALGVLVLYRVIRFDTR